MISQAGAPADQTSTYYRLLAQSRAGFGLDLDAVMILTNRLSLAFADLADEDPERFFLDNPVWLRPLIYMQKDYYFCSLPQTLLSFVFPIADELLIPFDGLQQKLSNARAAFLEDEVARLFDTALPGCAKHRSFKWKEDSQQFESDLVVRFDTMLIGMTSIMHIIAHESEHFHREDVEERERPTRTHHYNNLWSQGRPTVVYIGTVAIGLTLIEMSEEVKVRYVNGEYIRESEYVPPKLSRHRTDHTWTTTKDFSKGRFCLQAYSPYRTAKWLRHWREAGACDLSAQVATIVSAIRTRAVNWQEHLTWSRMFVLTHIKSPFFNFAVLLVYTCYFCITTEVRPCAA